MKISDIDNLDIGISNITIEGKVTYEKAPRHVEGDNEKGHYDFWSQFVVIEDSTGKIGCSVSIDQEKYKLEKGVMARVKGKLEEYKDKNGEWQLSLKASRVGISIGDKVTDAQQGAAEEYFEEKAEEGKQDKVKTEKEKIPNSVWEEKDLRIARECSIKAVTELVCAKIMKSKDFFAFADTLVNYIYNGSHQPKGKPKATKAEKIEKAKGIIKEHGSVEVKNESEPFPDEEIADEDIPGSSYNNAIKFKSKKKKINPEYDEEDDKDYIASEKLD